MLKIKGILIVFSVSILTAASPGTVEDIAQSASHACAVRSGAVYCWGSNSEGQLGVTGIRESLKPVAVVALKSGVTSIKVDYQYSCALKEGGVYCWGETPGGSSTDKPTLLKNLESGVTKMVLSQFHNCAIKNGAAYCWGRNRNGELGNGSTEDSESPVAVAGMESGVTDIGVGDKLSCALKAGDFYCWGISFSSGDGASSPKEKNAAKPVKIRKKVDQILISSYKFCTLEKNTVFCGPVVKRGGGFRGEGFKSDYGKLTKYATYKKVDGWVEADDYCVLSDGAVYCQYDMNKPEIVAGWDKDIAALAGNHCALTTAGAVSCRGSNDYGQLGVGDKTYHEGNVQPTGLNASVTRIVATGEYSCAIQAGVLKCWGMGQYTGTGSPEKQNVMVPTEVKFP